jgi:hypothetical protein
MEVRLGCLDSYIRIQIITILYEMIGELAIIGWKWKKED